MAGTRVVAVAFAALVVGITTSGGDAGAVTSGRSPALGQYIVVLKPGASGVAETHAVTALGGEVQMRYSHALNGLAITLPEEALIGVEHDPNVLFVSGNTEFSATAQQPPPPGPLPQFTSFALDRLDGEQSSAKSGDGKGNVSINIAVLDSGISLDAADLNVVGGTNCRGGNGGFDDPNGHGTLVAGIIAARDNTINTVGLVPGANLYAVRVLDKQLTGTTANILCGIDRVTATRTDGDPSNDIAVANMSLGGPGSDDGNCGRTNKDAIHLAICNSEAAGVTYVASAGNSTQDLQAFVPAAYNEVLTATAMVDDDGQPGGLGGLNCAGESDDTPASFSNFATLGEDQSHVIAEPGSCIPSTWLSNGVARDSGTSFASPHAAGIVGLCIAFGACAGLTPTQVIAKVIADASAYNTKHPDYGFVGDPFRPISGRYYGFLLRASIY